MAEIGSYGRIVAVLCLKCTRCLENETVHRPFCFRCPATTIKSLADVQWHEPSYVSHIFTIHRSCPRRWNV